MSLIQSISHSSESKSAWALLFASALSFIFIALYVQHIMEIAPCVMCIYQRMAMFGILAFAFIPLIWQHFLGRFIAFIGWGVSSIWGLQIAMEHVDIQSAVNPFFSSCEIVPNFPSFAPLHEWLPNLFAAQGDCGDTKWQFMDMSMPEWMVVIYGIYSGLFVVVFASRLLTKKI